MIKISSSSEPTHGSNNRMIWITPKVVSATLPAAAAVPTACPISTSLAHNTGHTCDKMIKNPITQHNSAGTVMATHTVMARRTQSLSSSTRGWVVRPGIMLPNTGPMKLNRSGTPIRSLRM